MAVSLGLVALVILALAARALLPTLFRLGDWDTQWLRHRVALRQITGDEPAAGAGHVRVRIVAAVHPIPTRGPAEAAEAP